MSTLSELLARKIITRLRAENHTAYLVGGCVRDLLLGNTPKDFDVATSATPTDVLKLFPDALLVGAQFGVVLVHEDTAQVEVATYRSDLSYTDGRRPDRVHFETSPEQDALRRDFTINALFMDPFTNEVRDFTGGRADLSARIIRAIGDADTRFAEDHLRLLRAIRFSARLNFTIEHNTLASIAKNRASIHSVATERVRDEIGRILTEGGARKGFELLDQTGLLQELLPEISALKGVAQPPEFHPEGDVWTHTLLMLQGLDHPSVALALGVLLHDVGKPATFRIADRIRFDGHAEAGMEIATRLLSRLKFSSETTAEVLALIQNHMKFMEVPNMRASTLKRFLRIEQFEDHMALHKLDCLSSNGRLANYEMVRAKQSELPTDQLRPIPLLNGRDLIQEGYAPGPAFSAVLRHIEDAQLEGTITTREEALEIARLYPWPSFIAQPMANSDTIKQPKQ